MSQFEYEAMSEKGIIESTFGIQPNSDGTFTFIMNQKYPRKKDKVIQMRFTKNGLSAITGILRLLESREVNK
ncbi:MULTISPECIES: hypothetical protein [Lentilactobacillus]|uniref:Uncharacterized protein n=1 Tax=Lentilactobacillus parakefiri TaxID=152332 RepID=A0A269XVA0_9LACO|nr:MULTISPECIES: hypothetical protein [Lentilactobacillus]AEB73783.1 hypothetical protein Lbuc_1533 [Lentilactobacillus buchneri NRRL B-30929]MCT3562337.1 hypothetical protein [Lentilactobacillus buchneri]MDH5107725.1 hypothetical protein [Lentilactobacillus kefiri]PAK77237.1 hypothetical protein B8W98_11215 [Lentilactobacillus parakefiri]